MNGYDPQKAARVWQRVQGVQSSQQDTNGLPALIAEELEDAATYIQLARRLGGKDGQTLRQLAAAMEGQPHAIIKATAFAFVLDHTRIEINEHDYFVGLYGLDRLADPVTFKKWEKESKLLRYIKENDCVYFVHSFYAARCDADLIATTSYGVTLTAAVARDNIMGAQFHPEKSGEAGLKLLSAFAQM